MKSLKLYVYIFFLIGFVSAENNTQDQLIIQLTHPGIHGFLEFNNYKGSITVEGYKGKVVTVEAKHRDEEADIKKIREYKSIKLSATERENKIRIDNSTYKKTIDVLIRVPYDFSLKLSTYDNGVINVFNVYGEIEIENYNGNISCKGISGSAVLSSVDGDLEVEFIKVSDNTPMAFTTVEGKIDISFPSDFRAEVKLNTEFGDLYSDFDISINKEKALIEKNKRNGTTKYSFNDWVSGSINGGGAEFLFKSLNGNIYLRKNDY